MAKYSMSDGDMDSAYGAGPLEEMGMEESSESVDESNAEEGENTAVVSNKILSPDGEALNKGDEIVVQIVENYGDESLIKYAPKKGGDETEYEEPMSTEGKELAALSEEGE